MIDICSINKLYFSNHSPPKNVRTLRDWPSELINLVKFYNINLERKGYVESNLLWYNLFSSPPFHRAKANHRQSPPPPPSPSPRQNGGTVDIPDQIAGHKRSILAKIPTATLETYSIEAGWNRGFY